MSEPTAGTPTAPPQGDAGWVFRLEMAVTNFVLGYWKVLAGLVALTLVGFFVYGQVQNHVTKVQRSAQAEIDQARADLYEGLVPQLQSPFKEFVAEQPYAPGMLDTLFQYADLTTEGVRAELEKGADALAAISAEQTGAAAAQAALEAAELYRKAGNHEKRKAALERAVATGTGVLRHGGELGLAWMEVDADQTDAAVARLRKWMDEADPLLGQEAALVLADILEQAGRKDEAKQVYTTFLERWPEGKKADVVRERQGAAG